MTSESASIFFAYAICVVVLWQLDRSYSGHWSPGFRLALWVTGLVVSFPLAYSLARLLAGLFAPASSGG